jgi:hypothetical protein
LKPGEAPNYEAYLFAHMMDGDYGRLYYSISLEGLRWTPLNGGQWVWQDYRGHADICRGPDGPYYLVGNRGDDRPVASHLSGPWFQVSGGTSREDWNKYEMTPKARHGSMRPISRKQYDALVGHFGKRRRQREGISAHFRLSPRPWLR